MKMGRGSEAKTANKFGEVGEQNESEIFEAKTMSAKLNFKCDLCGKEKNTNFFSEMEMGFPTARNWINRDFQTRVGLRIVNHKILTCSEDCDAEVLQRLQVSTNHFIPRVYFDEIDNAPHLDS